MTNLQIMLGVHGNGLSHQLWMQPQSVVIEVCDSARRRAPWSFECDS